MGLAVRKKPYLGRSVLERIEGTGRVDIVEDMVEVAWTGSVSWTEDTSCGRYTTDG
jgi:hypothetical protein